jgi:NitT/TauT family transport system substrate-binding protein
MDRRQFIQAGSALAALPSLAHAQPLTTVTIQIDGAAVPFYAPLYVAHEKGMFKKQGLDVKFLYASASEIAKNVAAGNVEFGYPNADAIIAARASDIPVKVIHTTYQRSIGATLFKLSSGIKTFADLKGKRVAVTSLGSPNYLQLQVGLKHVGLTVQDVKLDVISTGAIIQALMADQTDAIVFSELRRYNLEADGVKVGMISSNDFLPSFGNVLVTSDQFLKQKPQLAKGMATGQTEGLAWIINGNAEEAIALSIEKYAPTWKGQEALLLRAFKETFIPSVWQSSVTKANGLGAADLAVWQKSIDLLVEYKVIGKRFKAQELVVQPSAIA